MSETQPRDDDSTYVASDEQPSGSPREYSFEWAMQMYLRTAAQARIVQSRLEMIQRRLEDVPTDVICYELKDETQGQYVRNNIHRIEAIVEETLDDLEGVEDMGELPDDQWGAHEWSQEVNHD